jgi:chromate reductase, NAD(P)H dehydrogenase (quinone)
MKPVRILAVLGSLGAKSSNLELLNQAVTMSSGAMQVVVFNELGTLPFFDPDIAWNEAPATVMALRQAIANSDALLIACPEYGHSLPGVLKNAVDWLIGSGELEGKIVAITASVPHTERGRQGLAALKQTLGAVRAQLVSDEPIVRGRGAQEALREVLAKLCAQVAASKSATS